MTKNIFISMKSIQNSPDGEVVQNAGPFKGQYYFIDGYHYCLYEELMEGVEHPIKSRLKFNEEKVFLHKSGDISFDTVFEVGNDHISNYNTMFGPICIKTITKQLCVNDTSDMINISLHYDSVMADNYSTDTNMHICIKNA